MSQVEQNRTTSAPVGTLDDLTPGSMKMARVGERRIVVVRTASGVHALDNACPHQGYGLATGALDGELLTCQWHNWKFDVTTGRCVMGEEDVPCHDVSVEDGEVVVSVTEPSDAEKRASLWPSLIRGLSNDYVGQIARDSLRLLDAGATPEEIIMAGLEHGVPREEFGPGHAMATAADCLRWSLARTGDDRALPLVQGLAGISERTRGRPALAIPEGDPSIALGPAIESEDVDAAMRAVVGRIEAGDSIERLRHDFIDAATQHHLSYGHGIIYTQKVFELIDMIGDDAIDLLPHLAATLTWGTREDLLPYMKPAIEMIATIDLDDLSGSVDRRSDGWTNDSLVDELLESETPPIETAVSAALEGAGVEGMLDAVVLAVSRRLLRYDLDIEFDESDPFGWLDITHGLTAARAARWAWRIDPGPHTARQALWAVWLLFDTGRAERRHGARAEPAIESSRGDIGRAVRDRDERAALAAVRSIGIPEAARQLEDAALADRSGSFIVMAHLIKLTQAAIEESGFTRSDLPVLAATRVLAAPRLERFVARSVAESIEFVRTARPPKR